MNKAILLFFILTFSKSLLGQVSIGYYPFQSEVSISSNTAALIWGDLRIPTNTFFGNITTEPILMINIKKREQSIIYSGIGLNLNFFNATSNISVFNAYTFHFGARIKPLQQKRNIQCIFEVSPYLNQRFDGGLLRTRLGVAYQFN